MCMCACVVGGMHLSLDNPCLILELQETKNVRNHKWEEKVGGDSGMVIDSSVACTMDITYTFNNIIKR